MATHRDFYGMSYGSLLGQVYAELFPQWVGRMVLDSIVDPAVQSADWAAQQMVGVERALAGYVDACTGKGGCPLGADRETALARIDSLLTELEGQPMPVSGQRPVTVHDARLAIVAGLYGSPEPLTFALELALENKDASLLRAYADASRERDPATGAYSNKDAAKAAILCLRVPAEQRTAEAALKRALQVSPRFGMFVMNRLCPYWPVPATEHSHPINPPGVPPILLLSNDGDNATPIEWARAVH